MKALDTSFGEGASKNFIIVCKGNILTEIQVTLTPKSVDPSTVEADVTIKSMLDTSTKGYVRGCKEDIIIDQIGPG